MNSLWPFVVLLSQLWPRVWGHSSHQHVSVQGAMTDAEAKWGTDWPYSGISTFAHLPYERCLINPDTKFDIAIIGAPFDTAVSYRPGARFGPRAIRAASSRQVPFRGYNPRAKINPFLSWASILDCGDIPITPFDNTLALKQMTEAYQDLGTRIAARSVAAKPKLITLGGDHSIALPALRALNAIYREPIAVVHFDAHLDTWHPAKYPSAWLDDYDDGSSNMGGEGSPNHITDPSFFNHGSMFWLAHREGLLANGSLVHAGLRTRLSGIADLTDDDAQGWERISADEMDECGGAASIIDRILRRVESGSDGGRETPVYLSVDIDVLDPGLAPGTGTPEPGGWTTRELIRVLRGIERLNVVGADVVEVSPAYDGPGEATALAAAQVVYEILTSMVIKGKKVVEEHKLKDEL